MATQNNISVKDGQNRLIITRGFDIDGARAQAPFIPEIGEKGDSTWSGTGAGSAIAVLKAIWAKMRGSTVLVPAYVSPANVASGVDPMQITLSTADQASPWFTPIAGRPFNAWVISGTWSGDLYLQASPDGGATALPIMVGSTQLYVASAPGLTTVEEHESSIKYRWKSSSSFSGTAVVRISQ